MGLLDKILGREVDIKKLEENKDIKGLIKELPGYSFWGASEALGRLRAKEAVQPLMDLCQSTNNELAREKFIRALGEIGDSKALPVIRKALSDQDSSVREAAGSAIVKIQRVSSSSEKSSTPSKTEQPVDLESYYRLLSSDISYERNAAVDNLFKKGGIDGLRLIVKALKSDNENASNVAKWAIIYQLKNFRDKFDEKELAVVLNDVNDILIQEIKNVKLSPAPIYLHLGTNQTLSILKEFGNSSALPALNVLLEKVIAKRREDGFVKKYMQYETCGGWQDNDGWDKSIKEVIKSIRER